MVQLSLADPVERSPYDWNFPKKTARYVFQPTWDPVPTFSKFDTLVDKSPPNNDQETSDEQSPPLKVQMENAKLQRHIQFLQKHILPSKPTNLTCSTEKQTHTESTRTDTKTRTIENRNAGNPKKNAPERSNSIVVQKQSVTILGDSMILKLPRRSTPFEQKQNCKSEAMTKDILDHCKLIARKKPDTVILYLGTNDLKSNEESSIVTNIVKIKKTI